MGAFASVSAAEIVLMPAARHLSIQHGRIWPIHEKNFKAAFYNGGHDQ